MTTKRYPELLGEDIEEIVKWIKEVTRTREEDVGDTDQIKNTAETNNARLPDPSTAGNVLVSDGSAWISGAGTPSGAVVAFAGAAAPTGWLLCYGQAVSRTDYSALFTAISTTYGVGDGSTTFNLPDLRGRVIAGQDDMGGSSANRLTGVTGSVDGDVLGGTGGEEAHALTSAENASHTHDGSTLTASSGGDHTHSVTAVGSGTFVVTNVTGSAAAGSSSLTTSSNGAHTHSVTGNTGSSGSGTAHNNVQPTIILNWIIKT